MPIIVYNRGEESHQDDPNNYPIYRGGSVLANPYTHIKDKKTKATYVVGSREEAIERYDTYFDIMSKSNGPFKRLVDEIYEKYKRGETIYLECYCHPLPCHGDVIARKMQQRLIKEKLTKIKEERNAVKR